MNLASRGYPVRLLEQRPSAGGRAFSFRDPVTGDLVDNGQHLLIAGYVRTLEYLRTIGSDHHLAIQRRPEFVLHHPERGFVRFALPALPSPFHLLAGLLSSSLFSGSDRLALARTAPDLVGRNAARLAGLTVAEWLDRRRQPAEVRRSFWEPLAVSIMNEQPGTASAAVFVRSIHDAFLAGWRGAAMALPVTGLSELLVYPALEFIGGRGGVVSFGADVRELEEADGAVVAVRLRDGGRVECSAAVLAVPSTSAHGLLPPSLRAAGLCEAIARVPVSPIVSVHVWYSGDIVSHSVVGVIGRRVQWVFNHRRFASAPGSGTRLSCVISAAHDCAEWTNERFADVVARDLVSVFGERLAAPERVLVIREKRATFSLSPSAEALRPAAGTRIPNLALAGDWTATGLPATIEGAVVSGERAAAITAAFLEG